MGSLSGYILPVAGLIGAMLVLTSRRRGPKHAACGKCQYDLTGHVDLHSPCPECGSALTEVGVLPGGQMQRNKLRYGLGVVLIMPFILTFLMIAGLIAFLALVWR